MIEAILGPMWQYIVAFGGVALAVAMTWAFGRSKRKEGAADERAKHDDETRKRVDAGRKIVARSRGGDPASRLRANDDKWK